MEYKTREEWLEAAVHVMTPHFEAQGWKIPKVRVSVGWGFRGGLKVGGQCWDSKASSDGVHQIFVSPNRLDDPKDPYSALAILAHEVCHAVAGIEAAHGPEFKKVATSIGLTGKMTSTVPSDDMQPTLAQWRLALGPYPHAKLDPGMSPKKKQTTRMVKCECKKPGDSEDGTCGFMCRTSRKWIDDVGVPHCPKHGKMECDYIPPTDEEEGDEGSND